jgi:5'(3')-deoxyribonucleotidase
MKKQLFLDMDNTLALFSIKGKESESLKNMTNKGFFRNLPINGDAKEWITPELLEVADLHIITSCIDSPYCKEEKQEWLEEYFPFIVSRIFCKYGEKKTESVKVDHTCILVDDYGKNLIDWEQAGGIAIKKRFSDKLGYKYVARSFKDVYHLL